MVNKSQYILLIVLLQIIFVSCQNQLTADEYLQYVSDPENGLRKDQNVQGFELSIMYEPTEYLMAKKQDNSGLEKRVAELNEFEHFQFRIKLKSGKNILMYNETQETNEVTRINHFGFQAKNDFMIISAEDTNYCVLSHYSRNYNLTPTIDLTLAFNKIDKNTDWQLVYSDKQFNLGRIKFLFKKEDITDLPILIQ